MYEFISLVILVFGILQIILFFKLWGMTNDVKSILTIFNEREARDLKLPPTARFKNNRHEVDVLGMKNGRVLCKTKDTGYEMTVLPSELIFDESS